MDISSNVVKTEKNKITFVLPGSLPIDPTADFISLLIEGNLSKSPQRLKLDLDRILPKIISITPSVIKACDTIIIKGKNFTLENSATFVSDNLEGLAVIKATKESVVCIVKTIPKDELYFTVYNNRFAVNSKGIDLTEQRPEIISVSPMIYKSKDIITVKVKNFPYCNNSIYASIKGSSQNLPILSKTKDQIVLQLPEGCSGYFNIVFTAPANYYLDNQKFETPLLSPEPPEVYSIEPSHGSIGDEIVIKGNRLQGSLVNVLDVTSTSGTEIRGKVNQSGIVKDNGLTDVTIYSCGLFTKENAFTYDPVEILDFSPKIITSQTKQITITGKNFSTAPLKNTITIGSYTTTLASDDHRTLTVPTNALMADVTQSVNKSVSIVIKNGMGTQGTSSTLLQINYEASWLRLNNFPFDGIYLGVSFSINGKGYAAKAPNFSQYDPATDTWQKKTNFPGHSSYAISASANGKGYVGLDMTYNKEWWEYDPDTDKWNQKHDYPGAYAGAPIAFEIGGKIYVGGGSGSTFNYEFWEYNVATDSWTRKANIPFNSGRNTPNFSFKGKGYIYGQSLGGSQYLEATYDPNSNTWSTRSIESFEKGGNYTCMTFDNYVIFGGEPYYTVPAHNVFFKVVPGSGNVSVAEYAGTATKGQIGFSIGQYGYWGLGLGVSETNSIFVSYEMWKFDPSKFK